MKRILFIASALIASTPLLFACGTSESGKSARTGSNAQGAEQGANACAAPDAGAAARACEKGFADQHPADGRVCNSTYDGKCFETDAEACACAGCGTACMVLESYPSQIRCESHGNPPSTDPSEPSGSPPTVPTTNAAAGGPASSEPTPGGGASGSPGPTPGAPTVCAGGFAGDAPGEARKCDFRHAGLCFETPEAACACAGCGLDHCSVMESYPAQVACD